MYANKRLDRCQQFDSGTILQASIANELARDTKLMAMAVILAHYTQLHTQLSAFVCAPSCQYGCLPPRKLVELDVLHYMIVQQHMYRSYIQYRNTITSMSEYS